MVGVLAELAGAAGERGGQAGAEVALEVGERPAGPDPGEGRVLVHRVVPPGEALGGARGPGLLAGDPQQRAVVAAAGGRHPGEAAGPGAAGQPEEHLLGLVVEGVAEEDEAGAVVFGGGVELAVARLPGDGLEAAAAEHHRPGRDDVHGVQPQRAQSGADRRGDLVRPLLEPVVDDDRTDPQPPRRSLEPRGVGQGEGVRSPAARDEDEVAGVALGERAADRRAHGGDGRVRPPPAPPRRVLAHRHPPIIPTSCGLRARRRGTRRPKPPEGRTT